MMCESECSNCTNECPFIYETYRQAIHLIAMQYGLYIRDVEEGE